MESATMLAELTRVHDELRSSLSTLERVAQAATADRAELAAARWQLSRASGNRRKLLNAKIYPAVEQLSPVAAQRVADLRAAEAAQLAASAKHIAGWHTDHILSHWTEYQRASAARVASMRQRILTEKTLYPLLEELERRASRGGKAVNS